MIDLLTATWTDINAIDDGQRVLVMVVGPTEQHGPHLPFGTDIYAAQEMLRRILPVIEDHHHLTAIQAPPIFYVPAVLSREYPGSVSVRKNHFRSYLIDILASFAANGISRAILVSSHIDPPFVRAIQSACNTVNEDYGVQYISGYERFPLEDVVNGTSASSLGFPPDLIGDVHAGLMETANTLYIRPDLVHMDILEELVAEPLDFQAIRHLRSLRNTGSGLGYVGFPASARPEYGKHWFERYGEMFQAVVTRYLNGEDVRNDLAIDHLLPDTLKK